MRSLLAWLADVMLGPPCPHRCGYRGRGPRSLDTHVHVEHAGDQLP